jgi:hypothetical protein
MAFFKKSSPCIQDLLQITRTYGRDQQHVVRKKLHPQHTVQIIQGVQLNALVVVNKHACTLGCGEECFLVKPPKKTNPKRLIHCCCFLFVFYCESFPHLSFKLTFSVSLFLIFFLRLPLWTVTVTCEPQEAEGNTYTHSPLTWRSWLFPWRWIRRLDVWSASQRRHNDP